MITKETEVLVKRFCQGIVFNEDVQTVEEFFLLMRIPKNEIIEDLKESCKKIYYDNPESNYRIDQYGNAIEEDGTITSFEKLMVLCNLHLQERYK